jgi:hypothetical protein
MLCEFHLWKKSDVVRPENRFGESNSGDFNPRKM